MHYWSKKASMVVKSFAALKSRHLKPTKNTLINGILRQNKNSKGFLKSLQALGKPRSLSELLLRRIGLLKTMMMSLKLSLLFQRRSFLGKHWNLSKVTVVDTVIYLGSANPKADPMLKAESLGKTISVKQILEGSYILSPEAPKPKPSKPSPYSIFSDDPNSEYIVDLEDLYHLEKDVEKWRLEQGWLTVTLAGIKEAVDGYRKTHGNKNPSGRTKGFVEHGPFAGEVGWVSVCSWFVSSPFIHQEKCPPRRFF